MPIIHLPKPTLSSCFSWNLRKGPNSKPSIFMKCLQWINRPVSQKPPSTKHWKTKKIQTPPQVTQNSSSSNVSIFVTNSHPKSNHWTPPWDPPRSPREVPKPTRGAPENPQSSPRALRDPRTSWDSRNLRKINKKQRKSNKTYKNHRKSNGMKGNL